MNRKKILPLVSWLMDQHLPAEVVRCVVTTEYGERFRAEGGKFKDKNGVERDCVNYIFYRRMDDTKE